VHDQQTIRTTIFDSLKYTLKLTQTSIFNVSYLRQTFVTQKREKSKMLVIFWDLVFKRTLKGLVIILDKLLVKIANMCGCNFVSVLVFKRVFCLTLEFYLTDVGCDLTLNKLYALAHFFFYCFYEVRMVLKQFIDFSEKLVISWSIYTN